LGSGWRECWSQPGCPGYPRYPEHPELLNTSIVSFAFGGVRVYLVLVKRGRPRRCPNPPLPNPPLPLLAELHSLPRKHSQWFEGHLQSRVMIIAASVSRCTTLRRFCYQLWSKRPQFPFMLSQDLTTQVSQIPGLRCCRDRLYNYRSLLLSQPLAFQLGDALFSRL